MPDGFVRVPVDSTGKAVDGASLDVSTVAVIRQRIILGDNSAVAEFAVVSAGSLQVSFPSPPTINAISAAVTVSPVNISNTPSVVLAAGVANFGVLNNISATVTVAGVVGLTAGTAVIGDINAISRTVQVAIGTPFTVNNISAAVVLGAGAANIGTINNISAAVGLAAGAANIGFINNISATVLVAAAITAISNGVSIAINAISAGVTIGVNSISATVTIAIVRNYASLTVNSASRGPRMVLASTSANVTLVAAPGAGLAVYVTMVGASNASGTNTRGRFGTSATVGALQMMMAASGGGFVMQLDPPWKLSANEAFVCSVKPNVSEGMFNCHFFVASADAF